MNIVGIVVEYNPMHNGHLHHLQVSKENSDCLIAVLGGNFTSRGDVSPIDKFTKTKLALKYGVDLVIELPLIYTVQNSDIFGKAAISILNQLKVNSIYFGSESNDIEYLKKTYELTKTTEYNNSIKEYLDKGYSYPKASSLALNTELKSGDILNLAYLKAIDELNSNIIPYTIKRIDNLSSTDIRNTSLLDNNSINKEVIKQNVPKEVFDHYIKYGFNSFKNYKKYFNYSRIINDFHNIYGATEGIENSDLTPSKRYTQSRINRFKIMSLLNINKEELKFPPYIRILGMNETGKGYLNKIKKDVNFITKVKNNIHPYLDIEIRSTKLYQLEYPLDISNLEFLTPILDQ